MAEEVKKILADTLAVDFEQLAQDSDLQVLAKNLHTQLAELDETYSVPDSLKPSLLQFCQKLDSRVKDLKPLEQRFSSDDVQIRKQAVEEIFTNVEAVLSHIPAEISGLQTAASMEIDQALRLPHLTGEYKEILREFANLEDDSELPVELNQKLQDFISHFSGSAEILHDYLEELANIRGSERKNVFSNFRRVILTCLKQVGDADTDLLKGVILHLLEKIAKQDGKLDGVFISQEELDFLRVKIKVLGKEVDSAKEEIEARKVAKEIGDEITDIFSKRPGVLEITGEQSQKRETFEKMKGSLQGVLEKLQDETLSSEMLKSLLGDLNKSFGTNLFTPLQERVDGIDDVFKVADLQTEQLARIREAITTWIQATQENIDQELAKMSEIDSAVEAVRRDLESAISERDSLLEQEKLGKARANEELEAYKSAFNRSIIASCDRIDMLCDALRAPLMKGALNNGISASDLANSLPGLYNGSGSIAVLPTTNRRQRAQLAQVQAQGPQQNPNQAAAQPTETPEERAEKLQEQLNKILSAETTNNITNRRFQAGVVLDNILRGVEIPETQAVDMVNSILFIQNIKDQPESWYKNIVKQMETSGKSDDFQIAILQILANAYTSAAVNNPKIEAFFVNEFSRFGVVDPSFSSRWKYKAATKAGWIPFGGGTKAQNYTQTVFTDAVEAWPNTPEIDTDGFNTVESCNTAIQNILKSGVENGVKLRNLESWFESFLRDSELPLSNLDEILNKALFLLTSYLDTCDRAYAQSEAENMITRFLRAVDANVMNNIPGWKHKASERISSYYLILPLEPSTIEGLVDFNGRLEDMDTSITTRDRANLESQIRDLQRMDQDLKNQERLQEVEEERRRNAEILAENAAIDRSSGDTIIISLQRGADIMINLRNKDTAVTAIQTIESSDLSVEQKQGKLRQALIALAKCASDRDIAKSVARALLEVIDFSQVSSKETRTMMEKMKIFLQGKSNTLQKTVMDEVSRYYLEADERADSVLKSLIHFYNPKEFTARKGNETFEGILGRLMLKDVSELSLEYPETALKPGETRVFTSEGNEITVNIYDSADVLSKMEGLEIPEETDTVKNILQLFAKRGRFSVNSVEEIFLNVLPEEIQDNVEIMESFLIDLGKRLIRNIHKASLTTLRSLGMYYRTYFFRNQNQLSKRGNELLDTCRHLERTANERYGDQALNFGRDQEVTRFQLRSYVEGNYESLQEGKSTYESVAEFYNKHFERRSPIMTEVYIKLIEHASKAVLFNSVPENQFIALGEDRYEASSYRNISLAHVIGLIKHALNFLQIPVRTLNLDGEEEEPVLDGVSDEDKGLQTSAQAVIDTPDYNNTAQLLKALLARFSGIENVEIQDAEVLNNPIKRKFKGINEEGVNAAGAALFGDSDLFDIVGEAGEGGGGPGEAGEEFNLG